MTPKGVVERAELLVLPTDTVYGIGADPYSAKAVARLLAAKGRGQQMPPPVLAATAEDALAFADHRRMTALAWDAANRLAEIFWPGALTVVVPTAASLGWEADTVAVRVPDQELTREILLQTGPLAVTSANKTGHEPALTIDQARNYFGSLVSEYVDGGPAPLGIASTIVNLAEWPAQRLRAGALDWGAIAQVLEEIE